MTIASSCDQELLDQLRALPGWGDLFDDALVPLVPAAAVERAGKAVRAAYANESSTAPDAPNIAAARRRRTRRWVAVAVAGVAAAAVLVVAPTVSTPGNAPVSVATAADFLNHLAATATAAPGTDDAYWKVTFTSVNPISATSGSDVARTTTIWYARTGGQWVQTSGGRIIHDNSGGPAEFSLGDSGTVAWTELPSMSSDPGALEAFLRSRIGPHGSMVYAASSLLSTAPLAAPQRAALFTIMSKQPGITMVKGVTDNAGRTGTAIVTQDGPLVTTSVIIADDGTLLEILSVASQDHAKVPDPPSAVVRPAPGPMVRPVNPTNLDPPKTAPSPVSPTTGGTAPQRPIHKGDVLSRYTYLSISGTNTAPGR